MLKSFRLQGDILSYSPEPSKMLILPHLLKNLRKKYYLCEQSIGSNDDAGLLFFFTPVVDLLIFFTLKLLQKNLRYTVPETQGNWSTLIRALTGHQVVTNTCFCISSNYHLLQPSRDQRSVPDESLQVIQVAKASKAKKQTEVVQLIPGNTEIPECPHSGF